MTSTTLTREAVDRLVSDLRAVVRDGQEVLRAGAGDLSDKGKEARARLDEALQRARATCEQFEGRAEDAARDAARAAEVAIRDHPLASMGFAFGAGVLLGALFTSRR
jgi:ElaB/YqjD/DUF883 family membrane-anchored ribosome-binding protein